MQLPALWRGLFGLNIGDPYSQLVRGFFTAASIWAVGSIGAAAIFLVYNLFQRFNPLSRAPVAATPDPVRREFLKKKRRSGRRGAFHGFRLWCAIGTAQI